MNVKELKEALDAYPDDMEVMAESFNHFGIFPIETIEAVGTDEYFLLLSDV